MEGTQFPDPKYSLLTTSEKPPLTSENRENLATRLNCKTLQFDSACRLPTLSQTNHIYAKSDSIKGLALRDWRARLESIQKGDDVEGFEVIDISGLKKAGQ